MATAKKSTATKKSPVAKKSTAKRAPAKTAVKTKVSHTTAPVARSFRRSKPEQPFMTFKPSMQTFYWLILSALVLSLGVWVVVNAIRIQDLYNQIDAMNRQSDSIVVPATHAEY